MRKLMYLTVGFGAVSLICVYGWLTRGLILPAVILAVLWGLLSFLGRNNRFLRAAGLVCLGAALGLSWFQLFLGSYLSRAQALDGQVADVTARCTDYSYDTGYGTAVEGILYLDGKAYRAKFYVSGDIDMEPGDILTGAFRFQLTTPDSGVSSPTDQGKGIFLKARQVEDAELKKLAEPPMWAYPAILRQKLLRILDTGLPRDTSAFAKALLLGDRRDMNYGISTDLQVSGIMHIVAVSGLHVTILYTLIQNLCLRRRWLVAMIGIPVLGFFALTAGFSPSVIRACIMQGLMILASILNRDYDGPTELSFACLLMMAANPMVVVSVSFQLSVGCVIGIFLFRDRISEWMSGLWNNDAPRPVAGIRRWFISSVSMTLSAMSLTTPLVAWYFRTVSIVGIVTNLLTLWVVSFIFYGLMGVCVLGFFAPAAASVLGSIIAWPVRFVLTAANLLSAFPLAAVYTESIYIVLWLIFGYVILGVFLIMKKKSPGILAGCVALSLCLSIAASWIEPMTDNCRVTVLDVGQGQCILLQSEGKSYLVDCGGDQDREAADLAARTLLSQGISRLDGLILTHYDRDHAGGAADLLSRIPADSVFLPDFGDPSGVRRQLEQLCPQGIVYVKQDLLLRYGSTEIRIFAPIVGDFDNESSLAVLFRGINCDILITGDRSDFGERILLKTAELPDLEVLIAGHHGSKTSTCMELLAATAPDAVIISVGNNHYGHPAQEVLDRLQQFGCTVYRTDLDGTITIRR